MDAWRRMLRLAMPAVLLGVLALAAAPSAFAYHTDGREASYSCIQCHGDYRDAWTGEGPHGTYTTDTSKCAMCHRVHDNEGGGPMLLPRPTITASCFTCHDNTGAVGVFSSISARGGSVVASHAVDMTRTVPGGSDLLSRNLGCDSCHTPHRARTVEPFLRDTGKAFSSTEYITSDCLLRNDVGDNPKGSAPLYGGGWCAGCHDLRMSGGAVMNHPTTQTVAYGLGRAETVPFPDSPAGEAQAGFVMTATPRPYPYCQQCHEDARNVETSFSASFKDYGYPAPDAPTNPAYVTFPHQSTNARFTVEQSDDLCTNCHPIGQLP